MLHVLIRIHVVRRHGDGEKSITMKAIEAAGIKKISFPEAEKKKMLDLIYQSEWEQAVERYTDFGPEMVKILK